MPALILEGGTMRPIFTCGVLDALLDHDLMFDYVSGVSAGITYSFSYLSKQRGRNLGVFLKYRNDKRYLSLHNYKICKSMFGLDFVFDEVPNKLSPFDWETFRKYNGKILVGVTNAKTGEPEYLNGKDLDKSCTMLRATCAIPYYFPKIELNGNIYYDGGLADSVPIKKSLKDGNTKHLIVLTRPDGYLKKTSLTTKAAAKKISYKYPNLAKTMLNRAKMYNETIALCKELKKRKPQDTVILQPSHKLKSFESDTNVLRDSYELGYQTAINNLDAIKALFND